MRKGQMFLITAAIIVIILILLKTSVNLPNIVQRERELAGRFEREFFENVVDELVKVVEISYHQPENITDNVFDFGNFTKGKMTERLQDFKLFFVGSITPKSSGQVTMNITVINFLDKDADVILNLTNSSGGTKTRLLKVIVNNFNETNFTDVFQGETYTLTVNYTLDSNSKEENVTIETKVNQSVYVGFFDITLIGSESTYKDKFQKSYTLP